MAGLEPRPLSGGEAGPLADSELELEPVVVPVVHPLLSLRGPVLPAPAPAGGELHIASARGWGDAASDIFVDPAPTPALAPGPRPASRTLPGYLPELEEAPAPGPAPPSLPSSPAPRGSKKEEKAGPGPGPGAVPRLPLEEAGAEAGPLQISLDGSAPIFPDPEPDPEPGAGAAGRPARSRLAAFPLASAASASARTAPAGAGAGGREAAGQLAERLLQAALLQAALLPPPRAGPRRLRPGPAARRLWPWGAAARKAAAEGSGASTPALTPAGSAATVALLPTDAEDGSDSGRSGARSAGATSGGEDGCDRERKLEKSFRVKLSISLSWGQLLRELLVLVFFPLSLPFLWFAHGWRALRQRHFVGAYWMVPAIWMSHSTGGLPAVALYFLLLRAPPRPVPPRPALPV
eukprot:tig00000498_g1625.t1